MRVLTVSRRSVMSFLRRHVPSRPVSSRRLLTGVMRSLQMPKTVLRRVVRRSYPMHANRSVRRRRRLCAAFAVRWRNCQSRWLKRWSVSNLTQVMNSCL